MARVKRWHAVLGTAGIVLLTSAVFAVGSWSQPPTSTSRVVQIYGAFGPEGPRLREQLWILPSGDPKVPLRATVFRPPYAGTAKVSNNGVRLPLVIINHGTDENTRESVSMPVFYWLSRWFVERGYVVVVPQRRGHGATGGVLAEAFDNCLAPDHLKAGQIAADDIEAVLDFMKQQTFVDGGQVIVAGISSGGWASLALAARNPQGLRGVINFAGGRGAYAGGRSGDVCAADRLVAAAGQFGMSARVPTLWLYASNDSYFSSDLARTMAGAWIGHGGRAELHLLPSYGTDGHSLADDRGGWSLWGSAVTDFLGQTEIMSPRPIQSVHAGAQ